MDEYDDLLARVRSGSTVPAAPAAPKVDEYDSLLKQVRSPDLVPAQTANYNGSFSNPAQAAERLNLARDIKKMLGEDIAPSIIDPVEDRRRIRQAEMDHGIANSAVMRKWIEDDPGNAGLVGQKDIGSLLTVDGALHAARRAFGSAAAGLTADPAAAFYTTAAMPFKLGEQAAGLVLPDWMAQSEMGKALLWAARASKATGDVAAGARGDEGNIEAGVYSGFRSLGGNLGTMLTGGAIGLGAKGTTAMMSAIAGGGSALKAFDQGASATTALALGGADMAAEYATELTGMKALLATPGLKQGIASFARSAANFGVKEMLGEQVATVWQDFNEWALLNPEKTLDDFIAARPDAAIQTAVATLVGGGGQIAIQQAMARGRQAETRALFDALHEGAQNSDLLKAVPEKYREFVKKATADGGIDTVFIPAEQFTTYFQGRDMDPALIAKELGASNYVEAMAAGSDVMIPMDAFATLIAGTDHYAGLADDLRLSQGDLTARELALAEANKEESEKELEAELKRLATETEPGLNAQIKQITDDVALQLGARYDKQTSETMSQVMRGIAVATARDVQSRAQEQGKTASEAEIQKAIAAQLAKYDIRINPNPILPEILAKRPNFKAEIDPYIDMIRAGQGPSEQDIFGTSLVDFIRSKGGLAPVGELKDVEQYKTPAFKSKLIQDLGKRLDEMAMAAVEAGYFPGTENGQLTETQLVEAILNELGGDQKSFAGFNESKLNTRETLEGLAKAMEQYGLDPATMDNEAIKAALFPEATFEQAQPDGLRVVDVFGSGSRIDHYDDKRGLMYSMQKTATGEKWTVFEVFPASEGGDQVLGEMFKYRSMDEAKAAVRGLRISAAQRAKQSSKYGAIPNLWSGEAKKIAKALIDAGVVIDRFASSTQSKSKYIYTDKGLKLRLADHSLPNAYDSPDLDFRYGGDVNAFVYEVVDAEQKVGAGGTAFKAVDINSPEFKAWFGDSKVVTEGGKPLRVYHSTNNDWDTFDPRKGLSSFGFHAGTKEQADAVRETGGTQADLAAQRPTDGMNFMQVFLSLQNPLRMKDGGAWYSHQMVEDLAKLGIEDTAALPQDARERAGYGASHMSIAWDRASEARKRWDVAVKDHMKKWREQNPDAGRDAYDEESRFAGREYVRGLIESAGYDGIIYDNKFEGGGDSYIAFRPEQIKSAISNTGEFSKTNPNILYQPENRAQIRIGVDRKINIDLLKDANWSSFVHEVGHFYLEFLGDLAENGSQQTKDDYAAILKWMGVASRDQIEVKHHEMFARANERYLMEGKAPSKELRAAFARFKAWLTSIYRNLVNLQVPLTDEVREVFDRIYATDAEIASARAENDFIDTFAAAEQMGVSQPEFDAYKKQAAGEIQEGTDELRNKIMRVQRLKREAWWREELDRTRKEVGAELDAMKDYQTFDSLSAKDSELKIDRTQLVEQYGAPILKRLPRGYGEGRGAIYTAADERGASVGTVAQLMGYDSGDALVEAMANLRPRKKLIAAEADARMNSRYGDILNSIEIADEAQESLHNEERGKKLAMELRALRSLKRQVDPIVKAREKDQAATERAGRAQASDVAPLSVFTEAARRAMATKLIRDIRPNDYLIAERKANRKAFEALGKKDYGEAQDFKQQELLNFAMYREAMRVKDEMKKLRDHAAQFEKSSKREKLGKAGEQYLEAADAILEDIELKTKSLKAIDRTKLRQWLQMQENQDLYVTEDMVSGTFAKNWKDLTVEEMRAISDALRNIDHVAGRQLKIMSGQRMVDLQEAVDGAATSAVAANKLHPQQLSKPKKGSVDWFMDWMGDLLNVRTMATWLDGGKADGWWHTVLINRASDAQVEYYKLIRSIVMPVNEMIEKYMDAKGKSLDDVFSSRIGPVTRMEAISIGFNLGNPSNKDKQQRGGAPKWAGEDSKPEAWTEADINQIVGNLDAADWNFIQSIWTMLDTQMYPAINELEKRVNGVPLKKVEAAPFEITTKDGQTLKLKGGYYPMSYDPRFSDAGKKQEAGPLAGLIEGNFAYVTTPKGQTKERVETFARPANLDFGSVLGRHLSQSILDLTHREFFMDAQKFLKQPKIRQTLQERLGDRFEKEFNNWLKRIANQGANSPTESMTWSARRAEALRTNTTVLFLGFKITTIMAQFAGLSNSVERIGAGWMWRGTQETFSNPAKSMKMVMEKSGRMQQRWNTLDQSIYEAMGRLHRSKLERGRDAVNRAAFAGIAIADRLVSTPTWIGAYRSGLAQGMSEENAIHAADDAVISSQGDGASMELSKIQGERGFTRLFTVFYTPFAAQFNRLYTAGRKLKQGGIAYSPEFVMRAVLITMIPAIIADLLTGRGPQSCEIDDAECFAKWGAVKGLSSLVATMPFIREGGQMLEQSFEGNYKPDLKYSPVFSALERSFGAISQTMEVMAGNREMTDEVFFKNLEASGLALGLPTAQVAITGEYLWDLLSGEDSGETWYKDLFMRRKVHD